MKGGENCCRVRGTGQWSDDVISVHELIVHQCTFAQQESMRLVVDSPVKDLGDEKEIQATDETNEATLTGPVQWEADRKETSDGTSGNSTT